MAEHKTNFSYEEAFQRLEKILNNLNDGSVSLDQSLKLFEEANGLIDTCSKQLNSAEKKIQTLIKTRQGNIEINPDNEPLTQDFDPRGQNQLNSHTGELS